MKAFTPSLLVSIDDFILQFNFLVHCMNSYTNSCNPDSDPYISPSLITDEVFHGNTK